MPKFTVWGEVTVSVCTVVELDDSELFNEDNTKLDNDVIEELAIEKADEEFGGISNFAGNGGCDKLIGVYGSDDSIEADGYVEWKSAEWNN